jgi:AcrR family transcriptional regulator
MARPSQNLDRKLIDLGKEKIVSQGISNLSIRQICLDAKINLGMFYYYFKSKENFIKALFKSLNDDLTAEWTATASGLSTSGERLKKILFITSKMIREKHGAIETILKDTNVFDKMFVEIGKDIQDSWAKFFCELVDDCKRDGYLDKNVGTIEMMSIVTGAVHNYAKVCVSYEYDDEKYYKSIQKMIDFMIEKLK